MLNFTLDLDLTLGCGQVFRWYKEEGVWNGVVGGREVRLRQVDGEVEVLTAVAGATIDSYFRADDDLDEIYAEISADPFVASLVSKYHGLRLIRQDPWECAASYILASYASVRRIQGMVESLCTRFGRRLEGGRHAFPSPEAILRKGEEVESCGLGYRCGWLLELATKVRDGELDLARLREGDYDECVGELKRLRGVGDKVADCIALFSLDHLQAFPVDVRIGRVLRSRYGAMGTYAKMRNFAAQRFGRYAGYAQQFLYLSEGECVTGRPRVPSTRGRCTRAASTPPGPRRS